MTDDFQRPFAPPPLIFGVAFLAGLAIDFFYPVPTMSMPIQIVLGTIAVISGMSLIRSSMKSIGGAGTTYDPYSASTALVTSGVYRYTRNPGYLGLAVILFGLALMIDSPWIGLCTIAAVIVMSQYVIKLEEDKLRRTFGEEYELYLTQVRRWI